MTRNVADFEAGLYHGSPVRIAPGDIVRPNRHPLQGEDEPIYVSATAKRDVAKDYAWESDTNPGYLHVVEPLEGDDTLEQGDGTDWHHFVSRQGFRVLSVRKMRS